MKFIKSLYLNHLLFQVFAAIVILFVLGFFFPFFLAVAKPLLWLFVLWFIVDLLMLYNAPAQAISANRVVPERLSNGDENTIRLYILNNYKFQISIRIIDEIPFQFQVRDFEINEKLESGREKTFLYKLKPNERGEYNFGALNIYVTSFFGLTSRKFTFDKNAYVPVYPSFMQMRKYEIMAISNRLTEVGVKKIRRLANNNEFEQIKNYTKDDDFRTINWKATARRNQLMVNQFQDEKSQQVYSLIDMGRNMKMPFDGMTLLDYAINASLVISNIAMLKHDKAGFLTYSNKIHSLLPAERSKKQVMNIMELLYKQQTNYKEADFELVYSIIHRKIKHRSLLILYTNFEGISSMRKQLKYLSKLAKNHVLIVVFFDNTEINKLLSQSTATLEQVYIKTIAEKFRYEKRLIVKELQQHSIHSILTEPQNLSINTINKYLELKARGLF